jgi:TPR repeat protein
MTRRQADMTPLPSPITAWLRAAATVTCGLLCTTAPALAEPVPLDVPFLPLEVELGQVCVPRPPVHQVLEQWGAWDGAAFDGRSTELIRRDLRILRETDATAWFDTIAKAIDLLRQTDEGYIEREWIMDRTELALAAGRPEILDDENLVQRLLASGLETSPGAQYFAARLLREGVGIPKDEARARDLLVSAAYGGHSEALLELAALTSDGTKVEGWDIDPTLAVTLAFGGLVGGVDDLICDRINRIASAYRLGEVVNQDVPLAERWYRLAADLGDFNAAWQVAQMHIRAEGLEKDNGVLLAHLEQAAQGGLPYAQAELGRVYEIGALSTRNLDRARELYEAAAATGNYEGQLRLASLINNLDAPTEAERQERRRLLESIVAKPEPPAWALVALGDLEIEENGRWAGEAAAREDYSRALEVAPDDLAATSKLANLDVRYAETYQDFLALTTVLQETVLANGSASSMDDLVEALTCRSPEAPHPEHASYWRKMRDAAGNTAVDPSDLSDVTELVARAQSQAVVGRSSAYAVLVEHAEEVGLQIDPERLAQLSASAASGPKTELARLAISQALSPDAAQQGMDLLRQAAEEGESGSREALLDLLIRDGLGDDEVDEVRSLAEPLAAEGRGVGLQALAALDGGEEAARQQVYEAHRDIIEADGDAAALVFALPFLADDAARDDYMNRIRVSVPCDARSALGVAEQLHAIGRQDDVERWLRIAEVAGADQGWQVVAVADAYRTLSARPDAVEVAVNLLTAEREKGNRVALLRLASIAQDQPETLNLPPDQMATLFVELINASDVADVPNVLRRMRRAGPEVQEAVQAQVDTRALYEQAAEAGSSVGQLELAKIVQAEATGQGDLARYAQLLTSAAEQGEPEAMYLLSNAYSFGIGVEPSLDTSRDWLFKAADAGYQEAVDTVRLLQAQGITQ